MYGAAGKADQLTVYAGAAREAEATAIAWLLK
jgi:hypothetical protein